MELPRIGWCSFVKKTENSSVPKILRGYFRARYSFQKCLKKPESVLYSAANCSELTRNNFAKVFGLDMWIRTWKSLCNTALYNLCMHKICLLFTSFSYTGFLGFCNASISCHLTVKTCQIISDYWLFAWVNWKHRLSTTAKYNSLFHRVRMLTNNTNALMSRNARKTRNWQFWQKFRHSFDNDKFGEIVKLMQISLTQRGLPC